MTSNEIDLKQAATLKFDWSVSSESVSYDYVYYTITNLDTNKVVNGTGTSTKIGGTSYGEVYESLKFLNVSLDLTAGKYKIEWIDPWTGDTVKEESVNHEGGMLRVNAPDFNRDIAVAVIPE